MKLIMDEKDCLVLQIDNFNQLKSEAVKILELSKNENSQIEVNLNYQIEQLKSAHDELTDLRFSRNNEQNKIKADNFRLSGKSVLRSAFRYAIFIINIDTICDIFIFQ